MWDGILGALVTALIGGVGWLVKRWLDQRSPANRIQEAQSLVSLHRELKDSGATLDTISELKRSLLDRRHKEAQQELHVVEGIEEEFKTQTEMNLHAGYLQKLAETELEHAIAQYGILLEPERTKLLETAQRAWSRYARAQALFAASEVTGGSMYPLVYSSEIEQLTIQRAAAIRSSSAREKQLRVGP